MIFPFNFQLIGILTMISQESTGVPALEQRLFLGSLELIRVGQLVAGDPLWHPGVRHWGPWGYLNGWFFGSFKNG
jgi:hypothetical protein